MPLRDIIILACFIASLPICFFRPFFGILLWTVVAFLNLQWYTWSAATIIPWAMAVALPTMAGFVIFSRGWVRRLLSRDIFMIAILWVWFTITAVVSVNTPTLVHHADDTWYRWDLVSKILLMTVLMVAIVDSFARLRVLVLVMAGCFGFMVLKAVPFIITTGGTFRLYGPSHSMVADNNDYGLALNMTLPLFFFLARTESNIWVRRLFSLLFLLTIPTIFLTYSRGALIGLATVLFLMFLEAKKKQRIVLLSVMALAFVVAILFAPAAWKDRMDPTRPDAVDASANSRLNAWTYSWRLALDYPLTGGGFDSFTPELFTRYAPNPRDIHGPHSVYFGVLAEHGFIGLFLYLFLVFSCLAGAHRLVKVARFYGDQLIVNYANMFRFSLVGFLTSGIFLGRAYFDYFFSIVACLAVLRKVCYTEWSKDTSAELVSEEQAA